MKLYTSHRAPNPRRVDMFIAEKGLSGFERIELDLNGQEHHRADYLEKSALAKVPTLELPDGRFLSETRAICTYLEGLHPEPNLMGEDAEERAFIEMADRRMEWYVLLPVALWIRHVHPGLAPLEKPQFPDFGQAQGQKLHGTLDWLNRELQRQPWVAGERFTIADITAFCALEFARGLMKLKLGDAGYASLQAWRDRVAARDSAKV